MSLAPGNYGRPCLLNFFETKELLKSMGKVLQHILCKNEYSDNASDKIEPDAIDFVGNFMAEWLDHPDILKHLTGRVTRFGSYIIAKNGYF